MNDNRTAPEIPFIVYEGEQARAERTIKRMQILCGIMAGAILLLTAAKLIPGK